MTKNLAVKVPAVTAIFWIIKVLATTVGETFADFLNGLFADSLGLSDSQSLILVSGVMGGVLAVLLIIQFAATKYIPVIYWSTIVFISVAGTLITDNLHDGMGVELWVTTVVFALLLALVFFIWHRQEKTLEMKSINTRKREAYYWLAILFTFALGTSAGDQFAESFGFGYALSLVIFAVAIFVVWFAYKRQWMSAVSAFWVAYILSRPLGASVGDLLASPAKEGGLALGTTITSVVFLAAILGAVLWLTVSKRDEIK